MAKVIAAMNMTLDGFCDHTHGIATEQLHQHYSDLIKSAEVALYGRVTYRLMEYWRSVLAEPTGTPQTDDFAVAIDRIHKIVFSRTLDTVDWPTATLAEKTLQETVVSLKQANAGTILACSPSIILQLTQSGLVDEYQLCIHPVIAGSGLPLFKDITSKVPLNLYNTFVLDSGAVVLYYKPAQ